MKLRDIVIGILLVIGGYWVGAHSTTASAMPTSQQGTVGQVSSRLPAGLATVRELPAGPAGQDAGWVRLQLRAEQLDWVPSLLAGLDRPFVIERPAALRDHLRALAGRLAACADADAENG